MSLLGWINVCRIIFDCNLLGYCQILRNNIVVFNEGEKWKDV